VTLFFETEVTNWKRLFVKVFSGEIVHCYIGFDNGDNWTVYDFEGDHLIKTYKAEPKGIKVHIDCDDKQAERICEKYLGKTYDWRAIMGLALRIRWQGENELICSEFILVVLKELGRYSGDTLLSPTKAWGEVRWMG
jgi:hypothetical protein